MPTIGDAAELQSPNEATQSQLQLNSGNRLILLQLRSPLISGIPTCEEAPARNHAIIIKDDGTRYIYEDDTLYPGDGLTYNCEPNYIFPKEKTTTVRVQCLPDGTFPADSLPQEGCQRKFCNTVTNTMLVIYVAPFTCIMTKVSWCPSLCEMCVITNHDAI